MDITSAIVAQECFIILENMKRERDSLTLWQRWKTRKEYQRKRNRLLSLIKEG